MDNDVPYQSSAQTARIRRKYYLHSVLNGVSFRLLAGNIITLYALNLGAGNTLIGLLSSFIHISMLLLLIGRPLVNRFGAVRVQSVFWFTRYVLMLPILLTALPAVAANPTLSFTLIAVSVLGFHSAKGVALAGQQSILGSVVGEKGRGAVLSRIQSLNTTVSTIVWLLVGFALSRDPSRVVYAGIFLCGVIAGLLSSTALAGIPEPPLASRDATGSFLSSVRDGFANPGFRRLMALLFSKNVVLGMTGAFLIVQFRVVFGHSDANIVFITLIGSMGVIAMAAAAGLLMDRVGARPLYFAFALITTLSIVPAVGSTGSGAAWMLWVVPSVVIFFYTVGANGMMNCSQDYLFATITTDQRLNLGIVYHIVAGTAGFLGSVGGGLALDAIITGTDLSGPAAFQLFFGVMLVGLTGVSLLVTRLPDIGAYSILNTISILFSPRELRAFRTLRRFGRTQNVDDERDVIRSLAKSPSRAAVDDLLTKLRSPSFAVRAEALSALRNHPADHRVATALVKEVTEHQFTTAHIAAEAIGQSRLREGIPALRSALDSGDFMLCGKAMVALAELDDRGSLKRMVDVFERSDNPRVIIHGARAFATLRAAEAVPSLFRKLEPRIAPFIRDEIILAVAETLGIGDSFYPVYVIFVERNLAGVAELMDRTTASQDDVRKLVLESTGDPALFAAVARRVYTTDPPRVSAIDLPGLVLGALDNPTILGLVRFRFLVAAIAVLVDRAEPVEQSVRSR